MSQPPPPPQVSIDGRFYWDGEKWVPMPTSGRPPPGTQAPPAIRRRSRAPLLVVAIILLVGALALIGLVAGKSLGPSPSGSSQTTYIQVSAGEADIYLVSNDLDPNSWPDDQNSHKVSGLPNGAVQVCHFQTSQGVHYVVWSTGSYASNQLAREECYREGQ